MHIVKQHGLTKVTKVKKCIYRRGQSSFQVKAVINGKKIAQTLHRIERWKSHRESKLFGRKAPNKIFLPARAATEVS
jgi:hypothetical protein